MTQFLIRLSLIALAGGLGTLGFATLSEDGETLTIHVGELAAFLEQWAGGAAGAALAAWAAMWARAKKKGNMT